MEPFLRQCEAGWGLVALQEGQAVPSNYVGGSQPYPYVLMQCSFLNLISYIFID